jgi:hypothetical protein
MDLSTGHMAYTVHTQDARRAEQERERRRVVLERAAELAATQADAPIVVESARPGRRHGLSFAALLRGHRATAQ